MSKKPKGPKFCPIDGCFNRMPCLVHGRRNLPKLQTNPSHPLRDLARVRRRAKERVDRQVRKAAVLNGPVVITKPSTPDPQRYVTPAIRREVYDRDRGQCQYCAALISYEDCNIDHVIPWNRGGQTVRANLVVCCRGCNKLKGRAEIPYHLRPNYRTRKTVRPAY